MPYQIINFRMALKKFGVVIYLHTYIKYFDLKIRPTFVVNMRFL